QRLPTIVLVVQDQRIEQFCERYAILLRANPATTVDLAQPDFQCFRGVLVAEPSVGTPEHLGCRFTVLSSPHVVADPPPIPSLQPPSPPPDGGPRFFLRLVGFCSMTSSPMLTSSARASLITTLSAGSGAYAALSIFAM